MNDTKKLLNDLGNKPRPQNLVPIATDMFVPNHSGTHDAGILNKTPSKDNDLVNKKYVDDEIAALEQVHIVTCTIDNMGSTIQTGLQGYVRVGYSGTITSWSIIGNTTGSAVVDVWKSPWVDFPPTDADSITGTELPKLTNQQNNQDLDLTTWQTSVTRGDVFAFNVDSCSGISKLVVQLRIVS